MAAAASGVLDAIITALQAANGAGSYTYDLSGAAAVQYGIPASPGEVPGVYLELGDLDATHDAPLGAFRREFAVDFHGYVGGATQLARGKGILDLFNDIVIAVEADRSIGGTVYDCKVIGRAMDGEALGIVGYGVVVGRIECWWQAASGVGV